MQTFTNITLFPSQIMVQYLFNLVYLINSDTQSIGGLIHFLLPDEEFVKLIISQIFFLLTLTLPQGSHIQCYGRL